MRSRGNLWEHVSFSLKNGFFGDLSRWVVYLHLIDATEAVWWNKYSFRPVCSGSFLLLLKDGGLILSSMYE